MKLRFRFYLKLFVAIFAVLVTAGILWFIFRVEAYILSRLPPEIKIDALSVSFLNQSFILSGAKISGKPGTICEGKVVLEIGEAEGKFKLRQRKLTELILKKPAVKGEALKRGCFTKPGEKPEIRLGEGIGPEGLKITLHDGKIPLPELGEFDFNAVLAARENEHGALVVAFVQQSRLGGGLRPVQPAGLGRADADPGVVARQRRELRHLRAAGHDMADPAPLQPVRQVGRRQQPRGRDDHGTQLERCQHAFPQRELVAHHQQQPVASARASRGAGRWTGRATGRAS